MSTAKLKGKDLINVGIYTAIYAIVTTAVAMLGYIPILMLLLNAFVPLIAGIPFMLFMTKVKKFGMILIMGILLGLFMLLTGMGYFALPVAVVVSLIAELIVKSGNYQSVNKAILAYAVFSIWIFGNFLPMFIQADYFSVLVNNGYTQAYATALQSLVPLWSAPLIVIADFAFGILGGFLGKAVLKKHFIKAGIA